MAEINRITSFKTFSEIKATQVATQLAEENATKRSKLATKISALLDEMEITSFEDLAEDTKREFITKAFGNVSEEEAEVEVSDEIKDEEVTEAKELFQLDIDSEEHGALGLSVTMKELKDVYNKNKKNINDVEDLLLKFVYAQPEDFAAIDTEGMEISGANAGDVQTMLAKEFGIKEDVQHELNEAIIVTGKRGAKKVFNQLVKIWNEYPAFGANDQSHKLGILKQLFFDAMEDANFSREAYVIMKTIKGNIKPVTIKVAELGGVELKLPMPKIREAISELASRIATAGEWGGITIVEGTAMFLDYLKETKMAENLLNGFNAQFESVQIMESRVSEGRAFVAAARKAKDEGLEEFEYDGKTYPVLLKETKTVLNEGTRGQFGKIDKKGNITSVYMHYDSYPENILPIIKQSFKGGKNVDVVISKGNNSGLDKNVDAINYYNDSTTGETGNVKKIDQYLKTASDESGAEYVYLWDEGSKTWMMADIYGGSGLVPAFESVVAEAIKCSNKKGHAYKEIDNDGTVECEYCGLRNSLSESAVTEAKFVKDFNRDVLKAKTKEEVLELYPNAKFFTGKSDHFFGELDGNLFFKAYYTKAQKEFEIKSVYSQKGSNYVHLYNESVVTEVEEIEEGNAFGDAVKKAKEAGEKEFEFEGETFKVEEAKINENPALVAMAAAELLKKKEEEVNAEEEDEVEEAKINENPALIAMAAAELLKKKEEEVNAEEDEVEEAKINENPALIAMAAAELLKKKEEEARPEDGEEVNAEEDEVEEDELEESAVTEAKFDKKKLMKAMKQDDGIIQLSNGDEFIIYNPDNGNDENTAMWNDKVIFALDQDGEEHEVKYSDIVSYNESEVNEAEIKSDEEFTEYANTVLQKAFGEDFDEAKAKEVIDGILSKSDGDYGAAVGMLTSSLG